MKRLTQPQVSDNVSSTAEVVDAGKTHLKLDSKPMRRRQTHYQILGVDPGVTGAEIKRAYRKLVKSCHPDVDHNEQSFEARTAATERMMLLNEAYETLKDRAKRAAYDAQIGVKGRILRQPLPNFLDEDEARERYLKTVFHPARQSIVRVINMYQRQLRQLSQDIYDDELVAAFSNYCDRVEAALRAGSADFAGAPAPRSLEAAEQMMRYSIAQAADALEEMRRFCQNYDYDHLTMAGNLWRIAADLSRQALRLTR